MPTGSFTHFVFVDFENVPKVDLGLIAVKPVHVTLLIGKKQTRLDTALSLQMHRIPDQVRPIEVGVSGRNALDMSLAYYLGEAVKTNPGASFHIVSKDKDFEPLIAHLLAKGVHVARHESFAGLPFLAPKKASGPKPSIAPTKPALAGKPTTTPKTPLPLKAKTADDKLAKFIQHLRNSPPSNRTKLEHMISAFFKPTLPAGGVPGVVTELLQRKTVSIDASGKVSVL